MAQKTITKVTIEYSDSTSTVITGSSSGIGMGSSLPISKPTYKQVMKKEQLFTDVDYYKYDKSKQTPYVYIGTYERFAGYEKPSSSETMKQSDPIIIDSLVFHDSDLKKNNWMKINKLYTTFEQVSDEDIKNLNLYTKDTEGGGAKTQISQPSCSQVLPKTRSPKIRSKIQTLIKYVLFCL
jgi:hypothetical protein